jgi:hypothetical protein
MGIATTRPLGKHLATVGLIGSCHSRMIYSRNCLMSARGEAERALARRRIFCPFWLQSRNPANGCKGLVRQRTSRIASEESKTHIRPSHRQGTPFDRCKAPHRTFGFSHVLPNFVRSMAPLSATSTKSSDKRRSCYSQVKYDGCFTIPHIFDWRLLETHLSASLYNRGTAVWAARS